MYSLNVDPNNPRGNPDVAELRDLGVEKVRYTYHDSQSGDYLDQRKANFYRQKAEEYQEAGIGSLVILTYDTYPKPPTFDAPDSAWDDYIGHFTARAAQIAQLLEPFHPAYQVWNEPDHPAHPSYSPTLREAIFGRMLRRVYDAIKSVDPQALIVTAGLSSGNPAWLTTVINSLGDDFPADIVAFHPYGRRPDPDWPNPNWGFGYFGDLLQAYYQAGNNKPIWITEMGVKEEDTGNNRDQAAEFLRRYYRTITARFSDKVLELFWFCYSDGMVSSFGLVDGNDNHKPAYNTFRQVTIEPLKFHEVEPATATLATPPPPPPPTLATIVTSPPDLAQLTQQTTNLQNQVQALQNQAAQLQTLLQQLFNQQNQLQAHVQQLSTQVAALSAAPAPGVPITPPTPAPSIQDITNQLKRASDKQFPTRQLSQLQLIIIHHTAINPIIGAERIAEHRVDKQGWASIGYHYFITYDGVIQQTNELTTEASHAGSYNSTAIGVCFAGDFSQVGPTSLQIEAGAQLIAWLLRQFTLPLEAVKGYKELADTQSPGLQWDNGLCWGDQLKQRIQAYL